MLIYHVNLDTLFNPQCHERHFLWIQNLSRPCSIFYSTEMKTGSLPSVKDLIGVDTWQQCSIAHKQINCTRCNILICPHFPIHIRAYTNRIPEYAPEMCSPSLNLYCATQGGGHTGVGQVSCITLGQVFTIAHVGCGISCK